VNSNELNFNGSQFITRNGFWFYLNEDFAINIIVTGLGIISIIFISFSRFRKNTKHLKLFFWSSVLFVVFMIIFSLMLKWQPWNTRLLVPIFLVFSIGNYVYLSEINLIKKILPFFIFPSLLVVLFNPSRPIISYENDELKYKLLPSSNYYASLSEEWTSIFQYHSINQYWGRGNKKIGIICGGNTRIFPFMWNNREWNNEYHFIGNIDNPSNKIPKYNLRFEFILIENDLLSQLTNMTNLEKIEIENSSFSLFIVI